MHDRIRLITIFTAALLVPVPILPSAPGQFDGEALVATFDAYADSGFSGTALVARGDSIVLLRSAGWSSRARGVPLTPGVPMEVMSITKLFSALAVVMLHADGRLDLSAPITDYFPEFAGATSDPAPTVHDLLLHTAGLPERGPDLDRTSAAAYVASLARAAGNLTPGPVAYSNPGYGLIPILIERRTGHPFRRFVEERIFQPAGMTASGFTGDLAAATGYRYTEGGGVPAPPPSPRIGVLGATGIVTTAEDLFRWFRAVRTGGLLPTRDAERFLGEHLPGHGYSWVADRGAGDRRRVHKDGAWISFESRLAWYPEDDVLIVLLSNENRLMVGRMWRALEEGL